MSQLVTAKLRFLCSSPRKTRLLADMIRGRAAQNAVNALTLIKKRTARPLLKLVQSAIANAKHNYQLPIESLRLKSITVDGGPVLKRWMPKAHGRATPVRERTSHITVILEEIVKKTKSLKSKATRSK